MQNCHDHGVDIITFGVLRPTPNHLPIVRYVPPVEFTPVKSFGKMGFRSGQRTVSALKLSCRKSVDEE